MKGCEYSTWFVQASFFFLVKDPLNRLDSTQNLLRWIILVQGFQNGFCHSCSLKIDQCTLKIVNN
jgi:hypothetical protein